MTRIPGVRRVLRLGGWRGVERDVDEEMAFHLDARAAELVARGMEPAAAREAARREFGDVDEARTEISAIARRGLRRGARAERWDAVRQELRLAARGVRRQPGFAAVVALTLGLGVGANAAIFGVVDRLLLRAPPHIARADDVFQLHFDERRPESRAADGRITWIRTAYPGYEAVRRDVPEFERVA
ncbi:MAG TPA: permease prefix domain 1-containing protein, partial [Gemmatimonadaceae bacterium]|nr:permease prefix domain 1-containing protein [Gemmatimonadaceae bacterium]